MKRAFLMFAVVALAVTVLSCDSNEGYPKFLLFPKEGGKMMVAPSEDYSMSADNSKNEMTEDITIYETILENEWAKAEWTSRGILVTVQENDTGEKRHCSIDQRNPPVEYIDIDIYQDK